MKKVKRNNLKKQERKSREKERKMKKIVKKKGRRKQIEIIWEKKKGKKSGKIEKK